MISKQYIKPYQWIWTASEPNDFHDSQIQVFPVPFLSLNEINYPFFSADLCLQILQQN